MKLSLNLSLIILASLLTLTFIFFAISSISTSPKSPIDPESKLQKAYQDFNNATRIAGINQQLSQINYKPHYQEIEFYLNQDNLSTKVIISTQKNIYSQVAILQKAIKIAKIKGNQISSIDLGVNNPYATLKNY